MPIVEPAELLGHITTSDGRRIPHYKVKTETTITHADTGVNMNQKMQLKLMLIIQELLQQQRKLGEM